MKRSKYNRKSRQERAAEANKNRPAPTLENLKARLATLPKLGNSAKEIAKLTAKIAEMEARNG